MKNFLNFKIVSSTLCPFCNSENENPIHLFYSYNQRISLWSKFQELVNTEILLPQNTPRSAFFGFPDNKTFFEIIDHFHLILSIICLNPGIQDK